MEQGTQLSIFLIFDCWRFNVDGYSFQVRNERNKARVEAKQLRTSLEAAIKESNSYKREKNDLEMQINQLKKEMEKIHLLLMKHAGQFNGNNDEPEKDGRDASNDSPDLSADGLKMSTVKMAW